jgi:hypothetical protein
MGSEARLLLRAPLGVVEVEQKRPLNHVGERLRASLAEEALQDGEDCGSSTSESACRPRNEFERADKLAAQGAQRACAVAAAEPTFRLALRTRGTTSA